MPRMHSGCLGEMTLLSFSEESLLNETRNAQETILGIKPGYLLYIILGFSGSIPDLIRISDFPGLGIK